VDARHKVLQRSRKLTDPGKFGSWFIQSHEFQKWVAGQSSPLLICPGIGFIPVYAANLSRCWKVGASVSLQLNLINNRSIAIDYLLSDSGACIYYYFNFKEKHADVAGCLLKQIIGFLPRLPQAVEDLYDRSVWRSTYPREADFVQLITKCAVNTSPIFVVLDGLDECPKGQQTETLSVTENFCQGGLKVLITSRPHVLRLPVTIKQTAILEIRASEQDIAQYLAVRLSDQDIDESLKRDIINTIRKKADGMYSPIKLS